MISAGTYLKVPFAEKDEAKGLGARWDPVERSWYVPSGRDTGPFARWMPVLTSTSATTSGLRKAATAVAGETPSVVKLSAYLANAQAVVKRHLAAPEWVAAEIAEGSLRSPHMYLTLAETNSAGGVVAQARAVAFSAVDSNWFREFVSVVGQPPSAGMKVLVQVSAQLNPRYGFQLQILSIDSSYTLGEFARKVAQIRRQLESEGILRAQDRLAAPVDFTRVVVISPESAAGLSDFRRDASQLEELGLTRFTYLSSAFQGAETEKQLLAALARVESLHAQQPFDVCIVLRGGGSQLDLDWLNSLLVARAITRASLPVYTAIGHERDRVVLDEVSHDSFGTPSKVIGHIHSTVRARAVDAARDLVRIENAVTVRIDRAQSRLDREWQRTRVLATDWTAYALGRLQNHYVRVSEVGRGRLQRASEATQTLFVRMGQKADKHLARLAESVASLDGRVVHAARLLRQRTSTSVASLVQRLASTSQRRVDRGGHEAARSYAGVAAAGRARLQGTKDVTQAVFVRAGQRAAEHFAAWAANVASLDSGIMQAACMSKQRLATGLESLVQRLVASARIRAERAGHEVARSYEASLAVALRRADALQHDVDRTWHVVDRADPDRIMARGFVLVQQDGRAVTYASRASGEVFLRWKDGTRVAHIKPEAEDT